jgi:hypothetical protein
LAAKTRAFGFDEQQNAIEFGARMEFLNGQQAWGAALHARTGPPAREQRAGWVISPSHGRK